MRLSDAIRLGAMLKPQGRRAMLNMFDETCALGAALDAVGALDIISGTTDVVQQWRWVEALTVRCPVCGAQDVVVLDCVIHLNDYHRWTREAIADWVAQQEDARGIVDGQDGADAAPQPVPAAVPA